MSLLRKMSCEDEKDAGPRKALYAAYTPYDLDACTYVYLCSGVYMCVYIFVCMCICIDTCVYIYLYVSLFFCALIYTR